MRSSPESVAALAEILIEAVAHGASVSFMHPLAPDVAREPAHSRDEHPGKTERDERGAEDDQRPPGGAAHLGPVQKARFSTTVSTTLSSSEAPSGA